MSFNEKALIHSRDNFTRETLNKRREKLGLTNLARMELFLWDLEIYLHIQKGLNKRIVLKGGAAAQFYLPVEQQRTSVDIDMICSASPKEIEELLEGITNNFQGHDFLFRFRKHEPKVRKTDLPLLTYYASVPSICTDKELYGKNAGIQEIKIEFFFTKDILKINPLTSPIIFAFETNQTYQVLPLNRLIGDKLTTLGPNTVGIPQSRSDEQVKQIYDIFSLIRFNIKDLDFTEIDDAFLSRAKTESQQRGMDFNLNNIRSDILEQLNRLSTIDVKKDSELTILINNFQSLYLRKEINRPKSEWAIVGFQLIFFLKLLADEEDGKELFKSVMEADELLRFNQFQGPEKGRMIKDFKESFLGNYCARPFQFQILKGKNPRRIFWELITTENVEAILDWINKLIRK